MLSRTQIAIGLCVPSSARSLERGTSWGQAGAGRKTALFITLSWNIEIHPKYRVLWICRLKLCSTNIKRLHEGLNTRWALLLFWKWVTGLTGCLLCERRWISKTAQSVSKLTPYKTQQISNTRSASPMAIRWSHYTTTSWSWNSVLLAAEKSHIGWRFTWNPK